MSLVPRAAAALAVLAALAVTGCAAAGSGHAATPVHAAPKSAPPSVTAMLGCPGAVTWWEMTGQPYITGMAQYTQAIADGPLPQAEEAGAQLADMAQNAPVYPWASEGHAGKPGAIGTDYAAEIADIMMTGNYAQQGNLISAGAWASAATTQLYKLVTALDACGQWQ